MKILICALSLFFVSCTDTNNYKANILELGLGFSAQSMCSCLWVVGNDENFCREYVKLEQVSPRIKVDHDQRRVVAIALLVFKSEAEFLSERQGCRLK